MYPIGYTIRMIQLRKIKAYAKWLDRLRDVHARARILVSVQRLAVGNPGDVKPVGKGVSELRINYRPGCRAYYKTQDSAVIVLLTGRDKQTQEQDIESVQRLEQDL